MKKCSLIEINKYSFKAELKDLVTADSVTYIISLPCLREKLCQYCHSNYKLLLLVVVGFLHNLHQSVKENVISKLYKME